MGSVYRPTGELRHRNIGAHRNGGAMLPANSSERVASKLARSVRSDRPTDPAGQEPDTEIPVRQEESSVAKLKGTKTHENLKAAFAGESQANRRYLYFAKVADVEGYPE